MDTPKPPEYVQRIGRAHRSPAAILMDGFGRRVISPTPRQFDHIIAGLRAYQSILIACDGPMGKYRAIANKLKPLATEHGELMTPEEIDAFIEEINQ